jgi:hypothetical protein
VSLVLLVKPVQLVSKDFKVHKVFGVRQEKPVSLVLLVKPVQLENKDFKVMLGLKVRREIRENEEMMELV